ncbi:MAG: helix-turn-helix domain-containing protein [Candidatus Shapirobacteria bacterium]|nr:helix-turn-helix domain-containing protein [Candidatus Shapirobacteria bacterium]MDD5073985.1 helix-turn-helix domain-containing protein [Candidatus Shapirobacteria bacterium]MDD5481608.1 helix-turn-helix domain-containing protein [Candidatus Shapirobacteria bacterium]
MLRNFFVSKVRVKLLQTFFFQPDKLFYGRQLSRRLGEQINAIRRELENLKEAGLLKSEKRGNRIYFYLNKDFVHYEALLLLILKTVGLGRAMINNQSRLGRIKWVFFSKNFAQNLPVEKEEIDIFFVGEVIMPELSSLVAQEEKARGREINYSVMNETEFRFRYSGKDPFLTSLLMAPRFTILGSESHLLS